MMMFLKITEISFDGEHWFKADEKGGCVIRADDISLARMENPREF